MKSIIICLMLLLSSSVNAITMDSLIKATEANSKVIKIGKISQIGQHPGYDNATYFSVSIISSFHDGVFSDVPYKILVFDIGDSTESAGWYNQVPVMEDEHPMVIALRLHVDSLGGMVQDVNYTTRKALCLMREMVVDTLTSDTTYQEKQYIVERRGGRFVFTPYIRLK